MYNIVMADFIQNVNNKLYTGGKNVLNFLKDNLDTDSAIVSIFASNGISGFKFHIPQQESVRFESDITDNYTALNTAYQDHIALRPITITLSGFQGEYFYDLHPVENVVSTATQTIGLVKEFLPEVGQMVKAVKNRQITLNKNNVKSDKDISNNYSAQELWNLFQNLLKLKSAQTRAFLFFAQLWRSRCMFSVETSWKRYENMVIQSLTPTRDNNADITEFSITFKQLQFASIKTASFKATGNREYQASPVDTKTVTSGTQKSLVDLMETIPPEEMID